MHIPTLCDWFIGLPLLLLTPTTSFSLDQKQNASDTVVSGMGMLFSLDHKLYVSDYDSDSVASENQPLEVACPHFICLIPGWIGIWKCWFLKRGENQSTRRKTSQSKGEIEPTTNSTHKCLVLTPGFEPWATLSGRRVLSPQCQPCVFSSLYIL